LKVFIVRGQSSTVQKTMKLTTKLVLAFLVVSLVSIGSLVVMTRSTTDREFGRFLNNRLQAELVERLAEYYERSDSWDGIGKAFPNMAGMGGPRNQLNAFAVADANGNIILENHQYQMGHRLRGGVLETAIPIMDDGETVGYLLIELPDVQRTASEQAFINRINLFLFLGAFGAIGLAFIFGIFLSRSIGNPVRELTKATHAIANGNLGQQVPVRSRDEIGELAQSFNKMSSDLARSFNLRKQMTADIAHELRTPLALILGHAEGVKDGVLAPNRENFEIIREEAERLEHLVNDLRTLSLADAGELSVEFQHVNINDFMSDIHAHYLSLFNQKRITLNLTLAPVMLTANLDPNRFAQVVNNILDNALRHTPAGGRVELQTQLTGNRIQLSVKDSGEGVSSEEAAHLFDRFYRVDESRNRNDGGSGLGLAIAKSIVEMHSGKIWAESKIGQGLKVVIELPMT
jgi:two-component system, OmpR family, sensor histidine kinase BaeS